MERIRVRFEGDGAGTGGLAWGQQQVWQAMIELGSSMAMGGVVPVQDGRTAGDFAEELRFFMSRYGAMRSLLRFGPGGPADVTLEVFGTGEATLEVHDAAPAEDPAAVAAALLAEWRARLFDYANEWPIRMAVVRAAGAVTHVVVLVCHLATDGAGLATMIRELGERDPATGQPARPYSAMQPLDLVATQASRAAQRQSDNALRYWEGHLRTVPTRRFTSHGERPGPRFRRVVWQSRALHLAADRLAAALGTDPGAVLLAAYAVAFGRVTGSHPFVTQVIVGNRFRSGLADLVSPLAQNGLVVIDVAGATPAEAVERARQASMSASKYAYYAPGPRAELIERVSRERGEPVALGVLWNDRRGNVPRSAASDEHPEESRVIDEQALPFFNEELMLNVDDVPDTVQITTEIDTWSLPIEGLHALLKEMETFTVEAASQPVS
ncbi:condensation domain-containing protein [Dactylosporangium sucinum]|uniref:condensation domain-containing protein n=1 Tax=Dactylosporangium sucinum TaxID=1424081 RepID=UPI00167DA472|nr:condensation domain-containing protein [Dactylosporangium sucinum]